MTIARPQAEVFDRFRRLDHLPGATAPVPGDVPNESGRSHWQVPAPAGLAVQWDAEVINEVPPTLLAWRSLPAADVASAGSVHFTPLDDRRTAVRVVLQYEPPLGRGGSWLATRVAGARGWIFRTLRAGA